MFRLPRYFVVLVILLLSIAASACGPLIEPARSEGQSPTPEIRVEAGPTEDPDRFTDLETFKETLLMLVAARDVTRLENLMSEPFVSGWWRGELGDYAKADALRDLYTNQLDDPVQFNRPDQVDLIALLGGIDPLQIPRPEANVVDTLLVSGWGKDSQDEAILFIARQPDESLRWAGTLVIKGGFTSPETGGVQPLMNSDHGYQAYLPLGYEVQPSGANAITILAPQGSEGQRVRASIEVEPANGRTAEQAAAELSAALPPEFAGQTGTIMGLDSEMAVMVDRVPSQEIQRELFVVHNDRLYRMVFLPNDESAGEAYRQMENLYAVIVNTIKFLPSSAAGEDKLVADLTTYLDLLGKALAEHDKTALASMIADPFTLAFWRSEGIQISQAEALQQILNNYAPAGAQLTLDPNHPMIAQLYPDPLVSEAGEELIPVFVSGWGLEGQDEAVLFIARRADGSLYWQGALSAQGGFDQ